MSIGNEVRYLASHEWGRIDEEGILTVGISDHAQDLLGDIVFVDLPEKSSTVTQGDETAVVESVKTAADIYAPLNGTVIEVNEALSDTPELINSDPYQEGWIYRLSIDDASQLTKLLSSIDYTSTLED